MKSIQGKNKEYLTDAQKLSINEIKAAFKKDLPAMLQLPTGFGKTRVALKAIFSKSFTSNKKNMLIIIRKKEFQKDICPWNNELRKLNVEVNSILTTNRMFIRDPRVKKFIDFRKNARKVCGCRVIIILDESHRASKLFRRLLKIQNNNK